MGAVPLILRISIENLVNYGAIVFLTSLVIILIYLFLGLVTRSQVEAQVISIPAMLLVAFLPMLANLDKSLGTFVDYSFMGLFTDYVTKWRAFSWNEALQSSLAVAGWFVLLIICNFWALRRRNRM